MNPVHASQCDHLFDWFNLISLSPCLIGSLRSPSFLPQEYVRDLKNATCSFSDFFLRLMPARSVTDGRTHEFECYIKWPVA